jgi:hypothetical protein
MDKYLLIGNNLLNHKSHVIATQYLSQIYTTLYVASTEIVQFIESHNTPNTRIIIYDQSGSQNNPFIGDTLRYLHRQDVQINCDVVIFMFDWWFHVKCAHYNNIQHLIHKPKNYRLISFANIRQLSEFHKFDYSAYGERIRECSVWCCYQQSFIPFNEHPVPKLLLNGALKKTHYPERAALIKLTDVDILRYGTSVFNIKLNKYVACFASSVHVLNKTTNSFVNTHMILLKNFEILASGSLLVVPTSEIDYLQTQLSLVHGVHFLSIDFSRNVQSQIREILTHPSIHTIRKAGQEFAGENLTCDKKAEEVARMLDG